MIGTAALVSGLAGIALLLGLIFGPLGLYYFLGAAPVLGLPALLAALFPTERTSDMKGFLIGAAAVALPVLPGMLLHGKTVDAWDIRLALTIIAVGGGVAALWGLRKGLLDAGRASSMGGLAWVAALTLMCGLFYEHPHFAIGVWVVSVLPVAAFGILMGLTVFPCIRRI
jgi:hypothetical protein